MSRVLRCVFRIVVVLLVFVLAFGLLCRVLRVMCVSCVHGLCVCANGACVAVGPDVFGQVASFLEDSKPHLHNPKARVDFEMLEGEVSSARLAVVEQGRVSNAQSEEIEAILSENARLQSRAQLAKAQVKLLTSTLHGLQSRHRAMSEHAEDSQRSLHGEEMECLDFRVREQRLRAPVVRVVFPRNAQFAHSLACACHDWATTTVTATATSAPAVNEQYTGTQAETVGKQLCQETCACGNQTASTSKQLLQLDGVFPAISCASLLSAIVHQQCWTTLDMSDTIEMRGSQLREQCAPTAD